MRHEIYFLGSVGQVDRFLSRLIAAIAYLPQGLWKQINVTSPVDRLHISQGLSVGTRRDLRREPPQCICVDPPYYDNVMYAEL